ncbi:MAG: hypothetical protein IJ511_04855 [Bacteroides sp.]|nr:hypothetical protein [Bacteroides sp.]
MKDLKEQTPALTSDELIFCTFFLLGCSKELTADLMNTSTDAVKTRKSRIKSKMNPELFNWIFNQT